MSKRATLTSLKDSDLGDLQTKLTNYGKDASPGVSKYSNAITNLEGRVKSGKFVRDFRRNLKENVKARVRRRDRKIVSKYIKGSLKQKKHYDNHKMEQERTIIPTPKLRRKRKHSGPAPKSVKRKRVEKSKVKQIVNSLQGKMRQLINHTHLNAPKGNKKSRKSKKLRAGALLL